MSLKTLTVRLKPKGCYYIHSPKPLIIYAHTCKHTCTQRYRCVSSLCTRTRTRACVCVCGRMKLPCCGRIKLHSARFELCTSLNLLESQILIVQPLSFFMILCRPIMPNYFGELLMLEPYMYSFMEEIFYRKSHYG